MVAGYLLREKVFRSTGEEVPYSVAVTIDNFKYKSEKIIIHATIHVEKDTQKGIIIGKNGVKIKQIGKLSRLEIEKRIGFKIFPPPIVLTGE